MAGPVAVDCWACGRGLLIVAMAERVACGRWIAEPVAVDCWACGRRITGPVAVEGNVGGTKVA